MTERESESATRQIDQRKIGFPYMSLVDQVFSSRYHIEREIARGGMAEVYLARDESLVRNSSTTAFAVSMRPAAFIRGAI